MPRYIDAEFAEKEITSLVAEYENRMPKWSPDDMLTSGKDAALKYGYKADGAEKALEIVNKIPTADVQKVRRGHWIQIDDTKCQCSACDVIAFIALYPSGADKNFCPNCGCKLDLGGD